MPVVDRTDETITDDSAQIARLHEVFAAQKEAFGRNPYPGLEQRREHLAALAGMVVAHRAQIREALSSDFGVHPALLGDLIEVVGVAGRIAYAAEQVESWMRPEERFVDPAIFGTGRAFVRPEPKGVVGNMVPWNFPIDIALGPLAEMLAAGDRAIIKPSDYTPACAQLLHEIVSQTFDAHHVAVAVGGLELAKEFSKLRWDHLLYTGNPRIAREVMRNAAENLVPLTLELGGKNPVLVTADSVDAESIRTIVGVKTVKNGQMCISADYCLVPRERMDEFVELAREHARENLPDYSRSDDCTGIISERHMARLVKLLEEARAAGQEVVQLDEGAPNSQTRQMPLSLVIDPDPRLELMQEEIFGPILPVKPYDSLDEAIAFINAGERPLAVYVYSKDEQTAEHVLRETTSGGACVNVCAAHGAIHTLPFGGVGQSGFGRHHGIEGFREFSNLRGIFVRGENDLLDAFIAPYGEQTEALVAAALGEAQG